MNGTKRKIMFGWATGAAAMWFLDPDRGKRRRHIFMDKTGRWSRLASRMAARKSRYLSARMSGRAMAGMHTPDNPNPDDNTLRDRVESELLRHREVPKGDLNLNVAKGIVELRGQVESAETMKRIEELVRGVPNVLDVRSYLHAPGEPAPNKEAALRAAG